MATSLRNFLYQFNINKVSFGSRCVKKKKKTMHQFRVSSAIVVLTFGQPSETVITVFRNQGSKTAPKSQMCH